MRFARRAGKRDTLEPEVIAVAHQHGWKTMQLDQFDFLAERRGWLFMVEVKTGKKGLTTSQLDMLDKGWPLKVVRSVEEAEELFA
jgi:hypothetical protein